MSPSVRNSARWARRRTTDNVWVENTSSPPVNNATSASTLRLTRYARDMRSVTAALSCGVVTVNPAGNVPSRRARSATLSTPGRTRKSMRESNPPRANASWAAAISITA